MRRLPTARLASMEIAILLFDGFTALDAIGPWEVLHRLPGAQMRLVAPGTGPVTTGEGDLTVHADAALSDVPSPEVVVVPGGAGTRQLVEDEEIVQWVRTAHETSRYTTSVCTGSLVLAAAGVLEGIDATTHWLATAELEALGARYTAERVVERGRVITSAGVSSGIDMALRLAACLAGDTVAQAIQLGLEYDPQPPFPAGNPAHAPADVVDLVRHVAESQRRGTVSGVDGAPR